MSTTIVIQQEHTLHAGQRYRVRFKRDKSEAEAVMTFLDQSANVNRLMFDLRPLAGTQYLDVDQITFIEATLYPHELPRPTPKHARL